MEEKIIKRIRFRISSAHGNFSGEAIGENLKADSIFEVHLVDGNAFKIRAIADRELSKFVWIDCAEDNKFHRLVPVIGKVIERHFNKIMV